MSKFTMGDVVRRILPSGTKVGEPMVVKGRICGKDLVVCVGSISKKAMMYSSEALAKEPTRKLIVREDELKILERLHGIGVFYHELTKTFDNLVSKKPKYVTFTVPGSGKRLIYHLAKAEKVIKTIGFSHNDNYQPQRVVCPMIKLTFIGEVL